MHLFRHVNHRRFVFLFAGLLLCFGRQHAPQLGNVDRRAERVLRDFVERSHTDLTEVTRVAEMK